MEILLGNRKCFTSFWVPHVKESDTCHCDNPLYITNPCAPPKAKKYTPGFNFTLGSSYNFLQLKTNISSPQSFKFL